MKSPIAIVSASSEKTFSLKMSFASDRRRSRALGWTETSEEMSPAHPHFFYIMEKRGAEK
jgi:hypothetical protein